MSLTLDYQSDQYAITQNLRGDNLRPPSDYNKLRVIHFRYKNTTGSTIAADKIVALGYVPQGLILPSSVLICTDLGTSTNIDVGFDEYKKNDGTLVAADADFLIDGADVHTAAIEKTFNTIGTANVTGAGYKLQGFALLVAQIKDDTMASNGEFNFYIHHISGQ